MQALFRNIQRFGLQAVYQNDSVPGVKLWLRRIMAMTQLPAQEVHRAWWWCLKHPPAVRDPVIAEKLRQFSDYFESTWLTSTIYPPEMWSHYDNSGHKTTNHGEGFHSKLKHAFPSVHPPLPDFLRWLQQYHHTNQIRLQQLLDPGRVPDPKPQEAKYRKLHDDLEAEKQRFYNDYQNRVVPSGFHIAVYCDVVLGYLTRCAYLVGAN
jgi:hypothetical protein